MPAKLRRTRTKRTRKMRGGNEDDAMLLNSTSEQPVVTSVASSAPAPTLTENVATIGEKAKNASRKAVDWLKGWFGVGTQSAGGKRRKSRKNRRKTLMQRK